MALFWRRKPKATKQWLIDPGEPWSDQALRDVEGDATWRALIEHARTGSGNSYPSKTWTRTADSLVAAIRVERFTQTITSWLTLATQPPKDPRDSFYRHTGGGDYTGQNGNILKGIVWACATTTDTDLIRAIGAAARAFFVKVPDLGQRCTRVGNACVYALGQIAHDEAARQLFILQREIDYVSTQKVIDNALSEAAAARDVSVVEMRSSFSTHDQGDLLAEVYATPGSTELRMVYADHLSQAGDPRGEFILLQCMESPTRKQRARERTLLKQHRDEWLGPLADVLQKGNLVWERGFPAVGKLRPRSIAQAKALIGHPLLSTFRHLIVGNQYVPGELLCDPVMAALQVVEGVNLATAMQLARAKPATGIEQLVVSWDDYYGRSSPELRELIPAPGLPRLRDLTLNIWRLHDQSLETLQWLFASALGKQLERLAVPGNRQNLAQRVRELVTTRGAPPVLGLLAGYGGGWALEWHSKARHLVCALSVGNVDPTSWFRYHERPSPELIGIFAALPVETPLRITVRVPENGEEPWIKPAEWEAVQRASERFQKLEKLVGPTQ